MLVVLMLELMQLIFLLFDYQYFVETMIEQQIYLELINLLLKHGKSLLRSFMLTKLHV